jgi:hypothetical protein
MRSEWFFTIWIVSFLLLGGVSMAMKHTTTGLGAEVSETMWAEGHTYDASAGTQTEAFKFVWKDASENALTLSNIQNGDPEESTWTDVDLTAYTSANAKMAYITLHITVDTAAKDYSFTVRKNGTAPDRSPWLNVDQDNAHVADQFRQVVFCGLDSSQILEYYLTVEAGGQCDVRIDVLGYME